MTTTNQELRPLLEALLFLHGDSGVKSEDLTHILINAKPSQIESELVSLINNYKSNPHSGLMIQQFNQNHYRLCVKPLLLTTLGQLNVGASEPHLSPTMIEVATIVAYKGPMTRAELETFRGTDSSFILGKLRELNLVTRQGYKPDTRANLYVVTPEFFKVFNLPEGEKSLIPLSPSDLESAPLQTNNDENIDLFNHHDD